MADERVTLRGLAGRVRDLVVFGSGDHATGMERVRDNIQEQLEDLADSGHFIARRLEPGDVEDGQSYVCLVRNTVESETTRIMVLFGYEVNLPSRAPRVVWCIPLADLAGEVG